MKDFRIVYTRPDGGVSVIVPAPGKTAQECASAVPAGLAHQVVDPAAVPADREFRNAWVMDGKTIAHDIDKAREIAHERRRLARAAEFAPLDVKSTIPSEAAQAEALRQEVRDKYAAMQLEIDQAASVDSLKAAIAPAGNRED